MKNKKNWFLLIFFTFIFLISLIIIQVRWLYETAETEKKHFAQSVKLSLDLTIQQIITDRQLCNNIQKCLRDSMCKKNQELRKLEWLKIDSILKLNLKEYGIDCGYQFDVNFPDSPTKQTANVHEEVFFSETVQFDYQKGDLQLSIQLPGRSSFIKAKIGPLFVSSILLIILLALSFYITLRIYFKVEKRAGLIKDFLLNMAHEFKTPVSVIGLANSRMKTSLEPFDANKLNKYIEIIGNEKLKIEKQLTSILDLAYFENSNQLLLKEKIDLSAIIEQSVLNVKYLLDEKKAVLEIQNNCENLKIEGNKDHLVHALTNLLDNACKYSNGNLKIKISCFIQNQNAYIELQDNGLGISKKDLPYVFEKYFRVNTGNVHNIKGYGIGLSYVKEIIAIHGGKVETESELGKGSIFRIILPILENGGNRKA